MDTTEKSPVAIESSWILVSFMLILAGGFFSGGFAGFGKATSCVTLSCISLCLCAYDPSF